MFSLLMENILPWFSACTHAYVYLISVHFRVQYNYCEHGVDCFLIHVFNLLLCETEGKRLKAGIAFGQSAEEQSDDSQLDLGLFVISCA